MAQTFDKLPKYVFESILQEFTEDELVPLARVCRTWHNRIWDHLFDHGPAMLDILHDCSREERQRLIKHMPRLMLSTVSLIQNFDDGLNPTDFQSVEDLILCCPGKVGKIKALRDIGETFMRRARSNHRDPSMPIESSSESDGEESSHSTDDGLDPEYDNPLDILDVRRFTRFFSPKVTSFKSNCRALTNAVLPHLARTCPNLEVLALGAGPIPHGNCDHGTGLMTEPLVGWTDAEWYKVCKIIEEGTEKLFKYLMATQKRACLREVVVYRDESMRFCPKDKYARLITEELFQRKGLQRLSIVLPETYDDEWKWPWMQSLGPDLTSLGIFHPPQGLQSQLHRLQKLVELRVGLTTAVNDFLEQIDKFIHLKRLNLSFSRLDGDFPYKLSWHALEKVSNLTNLEYLSLECANQPSGIELPFTDERFAAFFSRLPHLCYLSIGREIPISTESFLVLSRSCPKLRDLHLMTLLDWAQIANQPGPLFPNLREWSILEPDFESLGLPTKVARLFSKLNKNFECHRGWKQVMLGPNGHGPMPPDAKYLLWVLHMQAPKLWQAKAFCRRRSDKLTHIAQLFSRMKKLLFAFENVDPCSMHQRLMWDVGLPRALVIKQMNEVVLTQAMEVVNTAAVKASMSIA